MPRRARAVLQTETALYIVTPRVTPLGAKLAEITSNDGLVAWGLHQVLVPFRGSGDGV